MAFLRCPQCNVPLTEAEASADACPDCASPLPKALPPPVAKPAEPVPSQARGKVERILLIAAVAVIVALAGMNISQWLRPRNDAVEFAQLRDAKEAAEEHVRVAQGQIATARAESLATQKKLKEAERSIAEFANQVQLLEQEAAAGKERVLKLEQEQKETQARLDALAGNVKRPLLEFKIPADADFKVITIDRLDRDYRLSTFNKGAMIKIIGRVRLLRLEHIENAIVDASELEADTIFLTGGINNRAKVKLKAKDSLTIPFIDSQAQVELTSREGKVAVGWINGGAQVKVTARDFHLRDYLDGADTTVTATLTAPGRFQFRELRGLTHFLWKKERNADAEVQVEKGIVRSTAELRQLLPDG